MGAKKKPAAGRKPAAGVAALAKEGPGAEKIAGKPLRPGQCEKHLRKAVAEAFRDIVDGFVAEAKLGGCQHVKMATEIVKSANAKAARRPGKGPMGLLMEKFGGEFGDLPDGGRLR